MSLSPLAAGFLVALALAASGCGARVAGHGDYVIRGSLVDSETGAPVSRKDVYVHAFNDEIKRQTSLDPEDSAAFTVRMPRPAVRLRVAEMTGRYRLEETTLTVPPEGLDHVVRLVPTHYILMKGRFLVREGVQWVPVPPQRRDGAIGGRPLPSFLLEGEVPAGFRVTFREDASYEVRLPRARVRVQVLDTPLTPDPKSIDLTGVKEDVVVRDVHLVSDK